MLRLDHTIDALVSLADTYARRRSENGPGHPDNGYLAAQSAAFAAAAEALQSTIDNQRAHHALLAEQLSV